MDYWGSRYWSEEGAGLAIDVPMHESYGSGINTGAGGQVRQTLYETLSAQCMEP